MMFYESYATMLNEEKKELKRHIKGLPEDQQKQVLLVFDDMADKVFEHIAWTHLIDEALGKSQNCDSNGTALYMAKLYGGVGGYGARKEEFKMALRSGYDAEEFEF